MLTESKICPECRLSFIGPRKKRFCCDAHKVAFHNREKANALTASDDFRPEVQEYATAWNKTLRETMDILLAEILRWREKGRQIPEIYGTPVEQPDEPTPVTPENNRNIC